MTRSAVQQAVLYFQDSEGDSKVAENEKKTGVHTAPVGYFTKIQSYSLPSPTPPLPPYTHTHTHPFFFSFFPSRYLPNNRPFCFSWCALIFALYWSATFPPAYFFNTCLKSGFLCVANVYKKAFKSSNSVSLF